jgi:hypothetical protein
MIVSAPDFSYSALEIGSQSTTMKIARRFVTPRQPWRRSVKRCSERCKPKLKRWHNRVASLYAHVLPLGPTIAADNLISVERSPDDICGFEAKTLGIVSRLFGNLSHRS